MQSAAEFRHNMIDGQLEPNQVLSPAIISAMGVVAREEFVPELYRQCAYTDEPISLDNKRFLASPLLLGRLLVALDICAGHKVLVMGAGTGYSAAVLHQLGCETYMLEEAQELANKARQTFSKQGFGAIEVHTGPLQMGWNASKPYDRILLEGGVEKRPDCWFDQLAEGGILTYVQIEDLLPLEQCGRGYITSISKVGGQSVEMRSENVASPILPGMDRKEGFEFA